MVDGDTNMKMLERVLEIYNLMKAKKEENILIGYFLHYEGLLKTIIESRIICESAVKIKR